MVITVVVLRNAREGLRVFGGPGAELRVYGAVLWAATVFVTLSIFASALRATTHHHALAGVTFAFGAVATAIGAALACVRVVGILESASRGARGAILVALGVAVALAVGWVGIRFVRAASRDPLSAAAAGVVVDVLAFGLAALFAARRSFVSRRAMAVVGPPVAVAIAALGVSVLREAPMRAAIDEYAPAFAPITDQIPGP
jgi:hypothetical protein